MLHSVRATRAAIEPSRGLVIAKAPAMRWLVCLALACSDPVDPAHDAAVSPDSARPDAGPPAGEDAGAAAFSRAVRIGETRLVEAAPSALVRQPDVTYDPDDDVYAIVHGQGPVSARVVSRDGEPIGSPIVVPTNASLPDDRAWSQSPRIAYAPGRDRYLVTWADARTDADRPEVWARFVRFDGATLAPEGDDFAISGPGVFHESEPALAYVPSSDLFVVTWIEGGVRARGVRLDGTMTEPVILATGAWFEKTSVAITASAIVVSVATAAGEIAGVRAFYLDHDLVPTGELEVATGVTGTKVNELAFDSSRVLAGWWEATPTMARFATRFLVPGGSATETTTLLPGYASYDGFALAYSPVARASLAVFHGHTEEDEGALIRPDGATSEPFLVTETGNMRGNFNPRVAASTREARWLVVTSQAYSHLAIQVVGVE
jgi:hypothetical protein